jgi:hypothetical protein
MTKKQLKEFEDSPFGKYLAEKNTRKPKKLKQFLVGFEITEDAPCYTFIIEAKDLDSAEKKALKIAKSDYSEVENRFKFYTLKEIKTLQDVVDYLLI